MDAISKISGFSRRNIEDYTSLHDILTDVETVAQENFLQTQATEVMERFLRKKSPNLLVGLDKPLDHLSTRASIITGRSLSLSPSRDSATPMTLTRTSTASSPGLTSRSALHSSFAAHRINIIYRLEMVEREIEEGKMIMDKLRKRFEAAKFLLQTEEENLKTELSSINESKTTLDNFINQHTDKKTGRVFYDKYLRFLESELQNKDRELRKMKLKTKTFQTEYNRMKSQQQQKLELRECLHPIDLDKLRIENGEQLILFEDKTKLLSDLKRSVGRKGQNLVLMKSKLNDTILNLKNIKQDIKQKEAKYNFTEVKEAQNINDLVAAEVLNQSIKKLNSTFKSPDVHTYLKMEVSLNELRREVDAWERRCWNQKQTISLLEHQLKQLSPPDIRSRSVIKSIKSSKAIFNSRSADSMIKHSRMKTPFPHCTPTTPM